VPISIKVENISKRLGVNQALDGITTVFEAGGLHGLIGSEGAGKTTLMRNLVGLLKPNTGKIAYFEDSREVSLESIRDTVSYMPAKQSLYADLSVSEHLDFFSELYQVPKPIYAKKKEELLHIARLEKFISRRAGALSGGMYKKLGLICALLQSPKALLLDEPTNGVDPISRREFWGLLYELSSQKILIIISTAYMDEAERCTKVHLLEKGKLLEAGEPRLILEKEGVPSFDRFFIMKEENGNELKP
jgi:ABC-2 type transport system ATP-binding protein